MISSVALSVPFIVLYAMTGGYSLLRWASLRTGTAAHPGDPVAEVSHVVMSLAMIGMVLGYGGSTSNLVQIVLFGVLCGYFAVRWVALRRGMGGAACPVPGFHLLMCAAMVWMVAAMPLLMGGGGASDGGMQMDGMQMGGGSSGTTASAGPTPVWASAVTVAVALGLMVAAGHWLRELVRPTTAHGCPAAERTPAPPLAVPVTTGSATTGSAAATGAAPADQAHTAAPPSGPSTAPNRLLGLLSPRADAGCHLLMSLAMAAMSLLML